MTGQGKTTFLLGVGAQKAGTTWLHDYLASAPRVFLPSPKELHVFDAMLRPDMFREFHLAALAAHANRGCRTRLAERLGVKRKPTNRISPGMLVKMIEEPRLYVDFFLKQAERFDVVGEITPSYAALSADDFGYVRDLLDPHFDVKVILLLRDPLDRAFSAIRHFRRARKTKFSVALRGDDNALFARLYDSPYIWERSDYPRIMRNLDSVFPAENIHIEFFERLFTESAIEQICFFLGLDARRAEFDKVVNGSARPIGLDPTLARRARQAYAPVYDYCVERFGEERIAGIWPNLRAIDRQP